MLFGLIVTQKSSNKVIKNELINKIPEEFEHFKNIINAPGFEEITITLFDNIVKLYKRYFPAYEKPDFVEIDDDPYIDLGGNH